MTCRNSRADREFFRRFRVERMVLIQVSCAMGQVLHGIDARSTTFNSYISMADIVIERSYTMGKEGARQAVDTIAHQLNERLQVDYSWHGDELRFSRPGADGRIEVDDHKVRVEIDLGLMLLPMKGMIQKEVEKYFDQRLR